MDVARRSVIQDWVDLVDAEYGVFSALFYVDDSA